MALGGTSFRLYEKTADDEKYTEFALDSMWP